MLNWKLYLSDLEKWQIHITGSHIPVESSLTWELPKPHHQRLDEDTRDLILKYKDKKDTASIEHLLATKKGSQYGQVVPSSTKIKRFMQNKNKYQIYKEKKRTDSKTKSSCSELNTNFNVSEVITRAPVADHEVVIENNTECANSDVTFYEALPLAAHPQPNSGVLPQVVNEQGVGMLPPASVPHIQIHHNATGRDIYINTEELIPSCGNQQEYVFKSGVTSQSHVLNPEEQGFVGNQAVMSGNQLTGTSSGTIIAGQLPQVFHGESLSVVPHHVQMLPHDFGDIALLFAACQQQQQQQQ